MTDVTKKPKNNPTAPVYSELERKMALAEKIMQKDKELLRCLAEEYIQVNKH